MGRIYLTNGFQVAGFLDAEGQVYPRENMAGNGGLGSVSDRGAVFAIGGAGRQLAHVDGNGVVYRGNSANEAIGRVEPDGKVYDAQFGGTLVGRVEAPHIQRSGAALLALIR